MVDGGLTIITTKRDVPLCSCEAEITKKDPSVKYIASVYRVLTPIFGGNFFSTAQAGLIIT